MNDLVRIVHPHYPGVARVISRLAYERRSRKLGWRITDEPPKVVLNVGGPVGDNAPDWVGEVWDKATAPRTEESGVSERDRLRSELDALGVKYHHKSGVAKLQTQLDEARTASEAAE